MALRCCNSKVVCPGAGNLDFDSPFANLSSETPDIDGFVGLSWSWQGHVPSLGSEWIANSCLGVCVSTVSQEDANLCAFNLSAECEGNDDGTGGGGGGGGGGTVPLIIPRPNPRTLFLNNPETCIAECPDGIGFAYTTPAGRYIARSQIEADRAAFSEACRFATTARMCLGELTASVCTGTNYEDTLVLTGGTAPITFTLVAGALPPGLFIELLPEAPRSMVLHGTATTGGVYPFTIRADDSKGLFMQKTFTISVAGIDQATLPDAQPGVAYAETLTASNMVEQVFWDIISGSLPSGLDLNSTTGTIHGTPSGSGTSTFTVRCTDAAGLACTRQFSIEVTTACWTEILPLGASVQQRPPTGGVCGGVNLITGDDFVFINRTYTIITVPDPHGILWVTPTGGTYGDFFPVTNQWWYTPFGGVGAVISPTTHANEFALWGVSDNFGSVSMTYFVAGVAIISFYRPGTGIVATVGAGPGGVFVQQEGIGPNDHLLFWNYNTSSFEMWYPDGSGVHSLGLNTLSDRWAYVNASGQAVITSQLVPAGNYVVNYWNGVAVTVINALDNNRARINSANKVVGLYQGAGFWHWTQGTGVVNIGLPPGAVSGSNCWITNSGLILVQANNGPWYYWNGAWGQAVDLMSPPAGFVVTGINEVSRDGYGMVGGTLGGNGRTLICKWCTPP